MGEMGLRMFNDAQAAISMRKMVASSSQALRVACEMLSTFAQNSQVVD